MAKFSVTVSSANIIPTSFSPGCFPPLLFCLLKSKARREAGRSSYNMWVWPLSVLCKVTTHNHHKAHLVGKCDAQPRLCFRFHKTFNNQNNTARRIFKLVNTRLFAFRLTSHCPRRPYIILHIKYSDSLRLSSYIYTLDVISLISGTLNPLWSPCSSSSPIKRLEQSRRAENRSNLKLCFRLLLLRAEFLFAQDFR